jgi:hypothetical protein
VIFTVDHCEWNPTDNCAAGSSDEHYLATVAKVSVGTGAGNFHVCDACAALPRFSRMKRRPLAPAGPRGAPPREGGGVMPLVGCGNCGHLACVCSINRRHNEGCKFRRAATCPVGIACRHDRDTCPDCDPCTCGAEVTAEDFGP